MISILEKNVGQMVLKKTVIGLGGLLRQGRLKRWSHFSQKGPFSALGGKHSNGKLKELQ